MADRFDIPQLKQLAKTKFQNRPNDWVLHTFPDVVREVLATTPASDMGLRSIIFTIFHDHAEELFRTPDLDNKKPYSAEEAMRSLAKSPWPSVFQNESEFLYAIQCANMLQ